MFSFMRKKFANTNTQNPFPSRIVSPNFDHLDGDNLYVCVALDNRFSSKVDDEQPNHNTEVLGHMI